MKKFKSDDVLIFKNVISSENCKILNDWAIENKHQEFFKNSKIELGEKRKTTRGSKEINYVFPSVIHKTYDNIKQKLDIDKFMFHPNGNEGIVCSISEKNGFLRTHKDPKITNHESLHLLIKTSGDEIGGNIIVNDTEYVINVGDCLSFFASINEHSVTEYNGEDPRITWFCSVQIPKEMISYKV